jgi:predicted Zn finger-like uncharacterized protein
MQTSCPECGTTFRVSQDQLGLRRGLVRCGHCNAVFNAYDTLLPELEEAPDLPPADAEAAELGMASGVEVVADAEAAAEADVGAVPQVEREEAEQALAEASSTRDALALYQEAASAQFQSEPEPGAETTTETEVPPRAVAAAAEETSDSILLSDLPNRLAENRPRLARWKTALYLLATLLLSLGLLAQITYFLRGELAAALPETRPLLNTLCRPLNCVVPLPKQLSRQAIVSSSLEHDTEQKSRIRLSFLLANRTGQTQTWPHVILTLSDVRESPVAQKAFAPDVYLPPGISTRAGFPAQSEQEASVELDIGSLAASSFVLSIAYP